MALVSGHRGTVRVSRRRFGGLATLALGALGWEVDARAMKKKGKKNKKKRKKKSTCQPDCGGKSCGDDGCGGICGTCTGVETCDAQGRCTLAYEFVLAWGEEGDGDGQFNGVGELATDAAGRVYAVDGNHRIQIFEGDGAFVDAFGEFGDADGQFKFPTGVAVDGVGNIFVADLGNHRIQKFTGGGTFLTKWGSRGSGDGQFDTPASVAVDSNGNVYVAEMLNHRVQKFDSGGTFITKWGSEGSGDGQFGAPDAIAVGGNAVVVAQRESLTTAFFDRVQKFSLDGAFQTKWGSRGFREGEFENPDGIAVDGEGHVVVADSGNHRVQVFAGDGDFLAEIAEDDGPGAFTFPLGVAADGNGNVFVGDTSGDRIVKFAPVAGASHLGAEAGRLGGRRTRSGDRRRRDRRR
jgi:DNA-binding beta-propeller fold protein YncE